MVSTNRVSTVDSVYGLVAILSDKLRKNNPGRCSDIDETDLCEGLVYLQLVGGYKDNLFLDFDTLGFGPWLSYSLEQITAQMKIWGSAQGSTRGIHMIPEISRSVIDRIDKEYRSKEVVDYVDYIHGMVDDYIEYFKKKKEEGVDLYSLLQVV